MAALAMSRAERETFLAAVRVGVISIAEEGRGPLTVPIWYGYVPGGEIWVVTGRDSRKGRLLRPGVRVGFVVQGVAAERAGTLLDTRLRGNGNSGHAFGTALPTADKAALLDT